MVGTDALVLLKSIQGWNEAGVDEDKDRLKEED
jgi:hypothetical protein